MEHFRVLPTDERFKQLTDHQINMMFVYYLMRPEDSILKELYRKNQEVEVVKEELPVDLLKAQGYTDVQIAKIRQELGAI